MSKKQTGSNDPDVYDISDLDKQAQAATAQQTRADDDIARVVLTALGKAVQAVRTVQPNEEALKAAAAFAAIRVALRGPDDPVPSAPTLVRQQS